MVVLVDLDETETATDTATASAANKSSFEAAQGRPNPNVNGFSAALSCYPIVRQLAGQLDLNTLHDLSRTCRQFRANLLEYCHQVKKYTLRCCYEKDGSDPRSGRLAKCARDMVGECQRCARVVCRNCAMKPPPTPTLRVRHRRLCRTCTKAPLPLLLHMATTKHFSSSDSPHSPIASSPPRSLLFKRDEPRAFTAPAFERTPCDCDNLVWLCVPCGKDLRNADAIYVRAWSWRTRYSHYLGGLGTGAGEGNEGVECGKGATCLGAKMVEYETCEQDTLDTLETAVHVPHSPERWRGTSYLAQEIEGIGGVLKVKRKKQVRVGECVKLYKDEREKSILYLEREVTGKLRSWCSWCERVVRGEKDTADSTSTRPTSSGSNSTSSSTSKPSCKR